MDEVELVASYHTLGVTQRRSKQMTLMVGLLVGNQNDSKYQNPENQSESRIINFGKKTWQNTFFGLTLY